MKKKRIDLTVKEIIVIHENLLHKESCDGCPLEHKRGCMYHTLSHMPSNWLNEEIEVEVKG